MKGVLCENGILGRKMSGEWVNCNMHEQRHVSMDGRHISMEIAQMPTATNFNLH